MDIQEITLIINTISMLIIGISALLLRKQIQADNNWNRRKIAEEMLTNFTSGDFHSCLDQLSDKYNWHILRKDGEIYENVVERLEKDEKKDLDKLLVNIYRNLETAGIKMRHGVLDEDLAHDYIFSVLTNIVNKTAGFVAKVRKDRDESCVYENAEYFALKWQAEGCKTGTTAAT